MQTTADSLRFHSSIICLKHLKKLAWWAFFHKMTTGPVISVGNDRRRELELNPRSRSLEITVFKAVPRDPYLSGFGLISSKIIEKIP